MIVIKAILQAQPGKEAALEALLKGIIPSVETEKETVVYTLAPWKQWGDFCFMKSTQTRMPAMHI